MAYTSGVLISGTTSLSTNAVAVSTTSRAIRETLLQSDPTNLVNVLIGSSTTSTPIVLTPGQSITIPVFSLSRIFVKTASSTGTLNWLARD